MGTWAEHRGPAGTGGRAASVGQHPPNQANLRPSSGLGEDADDTPSRGLGGSRSAEAEQKPLDSDGEQRWEESLRKFEEHLAWMKGQEREKEHLG